jgi:hypothetical protein
VISNSPVAVADIRKVRLLLECGGAVNQPGAVEKRSRSAEECQSTSDRKGLAALVSGAPGGREQEEACATAGIAKVPTNSRNGGPGQEPEEFSTLVSR